MLRNDKINPQQNQGSAQAYAIDTHCFKSMMSSKSAPHQGIYSTGRVNSNRMTKPKHLRWDNTKSYDAKRIFFFKVPQKPSLLLPMNKSRLMKIGYNIFLELMEKNFPDL